MQEGKFKPIQSVQRGADIIKCFGSAEEELSLTEISARLGLHKSTVYGLLSTLCLSGLLMKCANSNYRIGPVFMRFGTFPQPVGDTLYWALKERMQEIADEFAASCDLYLYRAEQQSFVLKYHAHPQNVQYSISVRGPRQETFHCCASGKLALAHMAEEELSAFFLKYPLGASSRYSIVDEQMLRNDLAEVRRVGFALETEEQTEGISSVAVPLENEAGELLATLSITGIAYQVSKCRSCAVQRLFRAAKEGVEASRL